METFVNSVKKENDQRTAVTSNPKRQQLVYNCMFSMARKTHPIRAAGSKGLKYKETRGGENFAQYCTFTPRLKETDDFYK